MGRSNNRQQGARTAHAQMHLLRQNSTVPLFMAGRCYLPKKDASTYTQRNRNECFGTHATPAALLPRRIVVRARRAGKTAAATLVAMYLLRAC